MTMKNSKMTDEWIARALALNPMSVLENGNVITMPVRLAFANIFKPAKKQPNDAPDKPATYGCAILFPPGADEQIHRVMMPIYWAKVRERFPQNIGADGNSFGLHIPFHPQAEKQNQSGYTPGLTYLNVTSRFKPQVVDMAMNPIIDEARVYSGVWAILALNCYHYTDARKKGVTFGLQSVMIVQDDENLGGGASDPKKDFANVKIDPNYNAAAAFGAQPPGSNVVPFAQPGAVIPPAQPVWVPPTPQPQQWAPPSGSVPATPPPAHVPTPQWAPPAPAAALTEEDVV